MRRATRLKPLSTLVLFAAAVAGGPATAGSYTNDRYGYSLRYPERLLTPEPEAANGDGRRFTAGDGVSVAVFANYRMDTETPDSIATEAEKDCAGAPPTYRLVRRDLVALSCSHAGTVYYQKTIIAADDLTTTIEAHYPARDKARWDKVIADMARSLRNPGQERR